MKLLFFLTPLFALAQTPQWTQQTVSNPPYYNGYQNLKFGNGATVWYGTDNANSIYSNAVFRLTASGVVRLGTSGSTGSSPCPASSGTWPGDHHPAGGTWYDSTDSTWYTAGGVCNGVAFNEMWKWSGSCITAGCTMTKLTTTHTPWGIVGGPWDFEDCEYDALNGVAFCYGYDQGGGSHNSLLYCSSHGTGTLTAAQTTAGCANADDWTDISSGTTCGAVTANCVSVGSFTTPQGWAFPVLSYVGNGVFIMFGGSTGGSVPQNATWKYTTATKTFTLLHDGTGTAPAGHYQQEPFACVSERQQCYVFDVQSPPHTWEFDISTAFWTDLGVIGVTNNVAQEMTMTYDPTRNALVLLVQHPTGTSVPEFWIGQFVNGLGSTTPTCIDKDGDGYGVGSTCTGFDADDNDASVHTETQAVTKWGTLQLFLQHLGYVPGNFWYLSTTGSDSATCHDTDAATHISTPCATFAHMVTAGFAGGDLVIMRGGTYTETALDIPEGSNGHPTIAMSYPGEQAYLNGSNSGFLTLDKAWLVIDGIKTNEVTFINGGTDDTGGTPSSSKFHDSTFRNIEADCHSAISSNGFEAFNFMLRLTIEDNFIHDCGNHGIYIGARGQPNQSIFVHRNVSFKTHNFTSFQHNGRVANLQLDQNFGYSVGNDCYSLEEGVSDSFVRSNVCIDGDNDGLGFFNYDPGGSGFSSCDTFGANGRICPFDQKNNLIENNTFYMTGHAWETGSSQVSSGPIVVANSATNNISGCNYQWGRCGELGPNTYRNNIFVNQGGNNYPVIRFSNPVFGGTVPDYASTSTVTNVVFTNAGGTALLGVGESSGTGFNPYSCSTAGAQLAALSGCTNSDPLFVSASTSFWNSIGSFDLHLTSGSPGLNAGTPGYMSPSRDIVGTFFGATPSLGAYQTAGSSSSGGGSSISGASVIRGAGVIR